MRADDRPSAGDGVDLNLDTPALVVDAQRLEQNLLGMAAVAESRGVALRPHVKTHKIPSLARRQMEAGAAGITVATISEAEVMADGGLDDIFVAYPLVTEIKIGRAIGLTRRGMRLILGVDGRHGAHRLSSLAGDAGVTLEVRLEVDSGLGRTGVSTAEAAGLAREISSLENLDLTGVYTYRGAVLGDGSPTTDLEAAGRLEGELMASVAQEIRDAGVPVEDVSVGSTPTAGHAAGVDGITEIRPGTYIFYDRMQAALGVCSLSDCALRVLVTVVSRPRPDLAIIDGGSKTFATDVQPKVAPLDLTGFGHVVGHPGAVLERVTEEHGMLSVDADSGLRVGDTVEIVPNHVCSTVNLHDELFMLYADGGTERVPVAARGMVR